MSSSAAGDHGLEVVTTRSEDPPADIITLRGDADPATHQHTEDAFASARSNGSDLIVDLSGLAYGDELLLGLLLNARTASPADRVLLVGPISESFRRRLDVTGTAALFKVYGDLPAALSALTAPPPT